MKAVACQCGAIKTGKVCPRCGRGKKPNNYPRRWRKFRAALMRERGYMFCVDCRVAGKTTLAKEYHHIIKVEVRPDLQYDRANIMPLCTECHKVRTARGE